MKRVLFTPGPTQVPSEVLEALFALDPYHPNRVEPRKRPFHTLIPAMVLKADPVN